MGVIEYSSLTSLRCWQQNFTISSYNLNNQPLLRYAYVPILHRCSLYEFCSRQLSESHPGLVPSCSLTFLPPTSTRPQTSPFIPVPFKSTLTGPMIWLFCDLKKWNVSTHICANTSYFDVCIYVAEVPLRSLYLQLIWNVRQMIVNYGDSTAW